MHRQAQRIGDLAKGSHPRARAQAGVGLVELMIAMAIGLVLTSGAISLYVGTVKSNADLLKIVGIDQELHSIMDLMLRDLRRAGGHGRPSMPAGSGANPFILDATSSFPGETANSCLTFSYDLDLDGVLDTTTGDERFGFRLRNGAVEVRRQGLACTASNMPGWEAVTDASVTRITTLQFTVNKVDAGAIDVRKVTIALAGHSISDSSINRSLVREVHVRNNAYAP